MIKRNIMNKNIALVIAVAITVGQIPTLVSAETKEKTFDEAATIQSFIDESEGVFKLHLEIAVEKAEAVTNEALENVVPVVVNEFKVALAEAKSILSNEEATQAEIDNSFERLSNVMQMLSFYKGDKTEIINLVDEINKLNSNEYTSESWDRLEQALNIANSVIADENALEAEVTDAYNNLKDAFDKLEKVEKPEEVDKSKLQELVNSTGDLKKDEYTTDSWGRLEEVLKEANKVLSDKKATQAEVNTAYDKLYDAIQKLEKVEKPEEVDKSKLQELVKSTDDLKKGEYTTNSWGKLEKALKEANKVLADKDATQAEVDAAYDKLETAIKGLVKVHGNGNGGSNGNGNNNLPQTGGTSAVAVGLFGSIIAAIGATMSKKRK